MKFHFCYQKYLDLLDLNRDFFMEKVKIQMFKWI